MRICVIGTGSIAEDHVRAFKETGGVEFDIAVSRLRENAERFAESSGFLNATSDVDKALQNGSFDTVIICSPSDLHTAQIILQDMEFFNAVNGKRRPSVDARAILYHFPKISVH